MARNAGNRFLGFPVASLYIIFENLCPSAKVLLFSNNHSSFNVKEGVALLRLSKTMLILTNALKLLCFTIYTLIPGYEEIATQKKRDMPQNTADVLYERSKRPRYQEEMFFEDDVRFQQPQQQRPRNRNQSASHSRYR